MRWLLMWTLFWLGHATSRLLAHTPDTWQKTQEDLYGIYNDLMLRSLALQKGDNGPWQSVPD